MEPIRLRGQMVEIPIGQAGLTAEEAAAWLADHRGQVFKLHGDDRVLRLHALGPAEDACREPINITSKATKPLNLVSNFAHTPFVLDDEVYASVEGFWQGLKFTDQEDRRRLGSLWGSQAKDVAFCAPASDTFVYRGAVVRVGTWDHWQLMERACRAKFSQHEAARAALLSTAERPLIHRMKRDSRTIPGVVMADIWMRIRSDIAVRSRRANLPRK